MSSELLFDQSQLKIVMLFDFLLNNGAAHPYLLYPWLIIAVSGLKRKLDRVSEVEKILIGDCNPLI